MSKKPMCEEPGCFEEGHFYWTSEGHIYLCLEHAQARGLRMSLPKLNDRAAYDGDLFSAPDPDHPCEFEGCDDDDTSGYPYPGGPRWFCKSHAIDFGFCPECQAFVGSDDDHLPYFDLCEDCYWEQAGLDDDDEWDENIALCPDCRGTCIENDSANPCPACNGAGEVYPSKGEQSCQS